MAVKSNGQLTVEDVSEGNTGCSGRTISGVQHGMSAVRAVEETRLSWSTSRCSNKGRASDEVCQHATHVPSLRVRYRDSGSGPGEMEGRVRPKLKNW